MAQTKLCFPTCIATALSKLGTLSQSFCSSFIAAGDRMSGRMDSACSTHSTAQFMRTIAIAVDECVQMTTHAAQTALHTATRMRKHSTRLPGSSNLERGCSTATPHCKQSYASYIINDQCNGRNKTALCATASLQPHLSQLDVCGAKAGDNVTQLDGTLHLVLLQLACIWTKCMKKPQQQQQQQQQQQSVAAYSTLHLISFSLPARGD
jgi:hypothetical protein